MNPHLLRHVLPSILFTAVAAYAADPVATVAFEGGPQGRIIVQAKINDHGPFPFLFDSGAINVISLDLAKQLDIKVSGEHTLSAFGGPVVSGSAVLQSIKLGAVTMTKTSVQVLGGGPFTKGGPVGLLGFEFLAKLVIEIDYEHDKMSLYAPNTYQYSGRGTRIPMRLVDNFFVIPSHIFGNQAQIEIDSGSDQGLVLYTQFVRKNDLVRKSAPALEGITGYGFGGPTRAALTRAPFLQLGGVRIVSPIVDLSEDHDGVESSSLDGNIGAPLLREFTVTFDAADKALYLEPNSFFGTPQLFDHSGLVLDSQSRSVKVLWVFKGSPAADLSIAPNDEVTGPNDETFSGDQWHDMLQGPPGTILQFKVWRAGKSRSVDLTLRDYIEFPPLH